MNFLEASRFIIIPNGSRLLESQTPESFLGVLRLVETAEIQANQ